MRFVKLTDIQDHLKVAIRVDDPFVGLWEKVLAKMDHETLDGLRCPVATCRTPMRYFCTSAGYMKAACPTKGCGASMSAGEVKEKPLEQVLKTSLLEAAESNEGQAGIDKVYSPDKPGALQ